MDAATAAAAPTRARGPHQAQEARGRAGDPVVACGSPSRRSCVFCLFPFYWLVNLSLKTGARPVGARRCSRRTRRSTTTSRSSRTPTSSGRCATARSSRSSTTVLALIVGSFCAYALARLRFQGKFAILALVLSITTFPAIAIAAPLFRLWTRHRDLQHPDRPDHPEPDVRAAAGDLHPRLVLQGDPEGPRGGGARRRRDPLHGVPQGRGAARGAGSGDRGHPDLHRGLERVPAGDHADVVARGEAGAGGDRLLHRLHAVRDPATGRSRLRR